MRRNYNVSLFYLSVGSGHQIAARAVADALKGQGVKITPRVIDPFSRAIEILPALLEKLQAASIVLTPTLYDNIWRHGTAVNVYDWVTDIKILDDLLAKELNDHVPDITVCTHVLPFALIQKSKAKFDRGFKNIGIFTDYGAHTYWPLEGVDTYFVGHEEIKNTLIFRGGNPAHIKASGIPIRPEFFDIKRESAPPAHPLMCLLIAGGVRSGAYVGIRKYTFDLLDALHEKNIENMCLTIVTGNQKSFENDLRNYLKDKNLPNVTVVGFVNHMAQLMAEHDMLITKPGGLTVAEALSSGLCMLLLKPGPGQETINYEFLARHGAALRGETAAEAVAMLQRCASDVEFLEAIKTKAKNLGRPRAAQEIAAYILRELAHVNA